MTGATATAIGSAAMGAVASALVVSLRATGDQPDRRHGQQGAGAHGAGRSLHRRPPAAPRRRGRPHAAEAVEEEVHDQVHAALRIVALALVDDGGSDEGEQHLGGEHAVAVGETCRPGLRLQRVADHRDELQAALSPRVTFGLALLVLVARHQHREMAAPPEEPDQAARERAERVLAAATANRGRELGEQHVEGLENRRVEELLLGREVEIERPFADPRGGRDVLDRHGVELARREHVGCGA